MYIITILTSFIFYSLNSYNTLSNWSTILLLLIIFYLLYCLKKINTNKTIDINTLNKSLSEEKEINERLNIVIKATSEAIWEWNLNTNSFLWNSGIETIFGYKKEEVENNLQWWFNQIHPEDSIKISVKLYAFIAAKQGKWQDEYRFKCADGTYKYVSNSGYLIKDNSDNVTSMIGSINDISKQKIEEQRLKLFETVVTQTKDSVIITETNENTKEIPKILYVNPAFTKMTGYNSEDVIGKPSSIFIDRHAIK